MLAGVFLATQVWVVLAFAPSRPDHHGLQALFFLMALCGAIRLLARGPDRLAEVVTAIGLGGGLWVSVEGLVTVTVPLVALGLRWIQGGASSWARVNARVTSWCALVLAAAVGLDGPQAGALAVVYDRISVVHLVAFGGVALFWWGVVATGWGRSLLHRAVGCLGAAVLLAGGLSIPFPGLIRGPLVDVDPRIVPIWLDHVAEYVTLLESGPRVLVMGIGSLVFALPGAWMAYRAGDDRPRWAWGLILGALGWFAFLGLVHGTRWAYYVSLIAPIPYSWLAARVFVRARAARSTLVKAAVEVGAVALLSLAVPLSVAVAGSVAPRPDTKVAFEAACPERELHRVLAALPSVRPGAAMLAPLWWGPEIVFRTELNVVSTPYHRNDQGILASRDLMLARSEEEVRAGLTAREIDYVLICRDQDWAPVLDGELSGSLFERLQRRDPPPPLREVQLPQALSDRFGLWRVDTRVTSGPLPLRPTPGPAAPSS
jgi:hypothetical protein